MAFNVPFASSPPSTPGTNRLEKAGGNNTSTPLVSGPSTTPLGPPPPSSAASFTPAGSPPSTILGSSQLDSQRSLFQSQANGKPARSSPLSMGFTIASKRGALADMTGASQKRREASGILTRNQSQPISGHQPNSEEPNRNIIDKGDNLSHDLEPSDEGMELDIGYDILRANSRASAADSIYDWAQHGASTRSMKNPKVRRGPKASRAATERPSISYSALYSNRSSRAKQKPSVLPTLAKSIASQLGPAELTEPQSLILETEKEIRRIYPEGNHLQDQAELLEAALEVVPDILARAWQKCCKEESREIETGGEKNIQVGPDDDLPTYHKATFIGNLVLKLYHPPPITGKQAIPSFRASRKALMQFDETHRDQAYPQLFFNWLDTDHNPFADVMRNLTRHEPNPTAHPNYWDMILSLTLRGRLADAAQLLKQANFEQARSAADDGFGRDGYPVHVINTIIREAQRAMHILNTSPGVTDDDWELQNYAWSEYRKKVEEALRQLTATSERMGSEPTQSAFDASKLTLRTSISELIKSAKQTEVKIPRIVFRNLQQLYKILLGKTDELLATAADWVEATVALTAWWDGEDDDEGLYSLSANKVTRMIDADPGAAYRKRLAEAFARATLQGSGLESTFQIDSSSPVDIALASLFENNLFGVFGLLRSFSLPITSAIIEIGTQGGWYRVASEDENVAELDNSDLMILSYAQPDKPVSKNDILSQYADSLFQIPMLEWNETEKEGWELAIEILSRMDSIPMADTKIAELISRIEVDSDQRADKLISLCRLFNLDNEANKVAEKYADHVAETSERYGTALIYYARAHDTKKVKDVLSLLISYCLVQSTSFPAVEDLDPHLSSLIAQPRESILWLANIDTAAAEILSINMSGYATLRMFYDIRDEAAEGKRLSFARKKAAAAALLTVISSASSSIQGGIYDPDSDAAVPFDVLLVLLGEAMPFVDTRVRYLSLRQLMVLLRAIEDLQTIPPRIRAQCDECLKSTLASGLGLASLADPQAMLKKSVSGLTASSGFSIIGESLESETSSRELQRRRTGEKPRGWDWRDGLQPGDGGDDIVGSLRLGLAREVARAWLDGEEL